MTARLPYAAPERAAPERWGASPSDWAHWSLILGLTEDLLPVVSRPLSAGAQIAPASRLRAVGKVPSVFNEAGHVVGLPQWTQRRSSQAQVTDWARMPDLGICVQTRQVRALDIDIDGPEADAVQALVAEHLGKALPARTRSNSGKRLLVFRLEGSHPKRRFLTDGGAVEFLANGQQFVACGTHPSGVRYEWVGGLPLEVPELDPSEWEALWSALVEHFDAAGSATLQEVLPVGNRSAADATADPVADWLRGHGLVLDEDGAGRLFVVCPWKHEHTSDNGPSETAWLQAGTGGLTRGHFRCLHAHCASRHDGAFLQAVGYAMAEATADFADVRPGTDTPAAAPFKVIEPGELLAHEHGARPAWWWAGYMPPGHVTLLGGHGGAGKSTLALLVAVAVALGRPCLGHETRRGRVAFYSAEDPADGPMSARLARVLDELGAEASDLAGWFTLIDATEPDPALYVEHRAEGVHKLRATAAREALRGLVERDAFDLVVVDNASDTFQGNEIDRGQVRAFVRGLVELVRPRGGAVLLLAHVDKLAARSGGDVGENYSGSTAWHNSVRSRLFLRPVKAPTGVQAEPGAPGYLELLHEKSNLGRLQPAVRLVWPVGGVPRSEPDGVNQSRTKAVRALVRLVVEFNDRGDRVPVPAGGSGSAAVVLRDAPGYPPGIRPGEVAHLLREAEAAGLLERVAYTTAGRRQSQCWVATEAGRVAAASE